MKCQYCNENEAQNTFLVNFPGGQQEVHLCAECTERLRHYYGAMAQAAQQGGFPGWGGSLPRKVGDSPFPEDAGGEVRKRRLINSLRAQMSQAVTEERYEEAARLRDEIAQAEKEYVYEQ